MTLHHNGAILHASSLTGTASGLLAWETEKCALHLGVHVNLEITPDEKPELDRLAGRMASVLSAREVNREVR